MKIASVSIRNIKGIDALDLQPGTFTVIRGHNGSGKSSVIDAIRAVFAGGSDPNWLHGWPESPAKKGSIKLEIVNEDGELVATIEKSITLKKSGEGVTVTLEVIDANGVPIPGPQTWVNQLGESWAVDPGSILKLDTSTAAGRKALVGKLLEIMPIRFDVAELGAAIGELPIPGIERPCDLDGLAKHRKYIEEMRRRVGIEAKEAEGSVSALRKSLPPAEEDAVDWVQRERQLLSDRNSLVQREADSVAEIHRAASVERDGINEDFAHREAALRTEFQQKMAALAEEKRTAIVNLAGTEAAAAAEVQTGFRPEHDRITAELATARERAAAQQRAAGVREQLDAFSAKVRAKNSEYDRIGDVLKRLDDLRKQKFDALPLPDVRYEGDQVYVRGVAWDQVNTAERLKLGMQISSMRAGSLPFMVADDVEHLDADTLRECRDGLADAGFQLVVAVVDNCPLRVEQVA